MYCVASIYQVFLPSIGILRELIELSNGRKQRKNCGSEKDEWEINYYIRVAVVSLFEFENFVFRYLDHQCWYESLEIEIRTISEDLFSNFSMYISILVE